MKIFIQRSYLISHLSWTGARYVVRIITQNAQKNMRNNSTEQRWYIYNQLHFLLLIKWTRTTPKWICFKNFSAVTFQNNSINIISSGRWTLYRYWYFQIKQSKVDQTAGKNLVTGLVYFKYNQYMKYIRQMCLVFISVSSKTLKLIWFTISHPYKLGSTQQTAQTDRHMDK